MRDAHDAELRIAVAEGILSRDEADALGAEASRLRQSPLGLLFERGRLSTGTFASLRRRVPETTDTEVADTESELESTSFPIPGWDRYRCLRFLGQGGMGKVFLAWDPRLHRDVAIKLVRGDAPDAIRRLVAEARAQARVSHDRVCKVYEVGEVEGQVYIAMQYIDGEPLSALSGTLTVEQTVMILRDAALGVHEAHRAGIVHRDIKPSNIMVERAEDGALRPYVMDFGLARSLRAESATETGSVLGTPCYMAPEQARGEVGRLDRRADVYSLGASLYHLLTGEPPIPGGNALVVLNNIATVEPRSPRAVDPDIPVDLEAIVMRCLEKDRSARYDSARALADDLDRFLRGEPVAARRAGTWYRWEKRLRKHRRLVTAAGAALGLVIAALGFGIEARREAAERERLARRFTEMVEHVEAAARYSALSPLHDIRGDQRALRAQMDQLREEIRQGGEIAEGPGNYALGRGYLALGDERQAKAHLELSWQRGFHEPRAAYALALVTGHFYREALREADRIEQKEQREAKRRAVEQRYREPVLAYLRQSAGAAVPSTEYVAALVASYEDRLDDALRHLDAVGDGLPWFYEAPLLRGDVLEARAAKRRDKGDREGAMADFAAGRAAYLAAAAAGESVPAVHEALGELERAELLLELYGRGDVQPRFDRGVAAAARALRIQPDRYSSLVLDAVLRRRFAEHRMNHGDEVGDLLHDALASAQHALAVAPERAEARLELGRIYWQWGNDLQNRSRDPSEPLQKAIDTYAGIGAEDRDYEYHRQVGLIFDVWADYEGQIGADALPHRGRAIESFLTATRVDDRLPHAFINLGTAYFMRASYPRDPDVDSDLEQARAALEKARALDPGNVVACFYGAEVHEKRARRQRARGGDARPDLIAALDLERRGIAINPGLPHLHNGAGTILLDQAREAWDRGADPDPLLAEARAAFERAIAVAPQQGFGYHNVGEVLAQRTAYQRSRGEDPEPAARTAVAAIERAIERLPDHAGPRANLGMVHAIMAAFALDAGRDPRPSLSLAAAALEKAIERDPSDAQARRYLGEVRAIEARFQARKGLARAADFEAAAEAFQKAIEADPEEQDHRLAVGHFDREWAIWLKETGGDPTLALSRGLALATDLLSSRPAWAEARILRATLLLARASAASRPEDRRADAEQALADFTFALAQNPNFERVWRARAALAQQLAAAPR
ncbi:MAG: protein kinase [Minicystis sp.]